MNIKRWWKRRQVLKRKFLIKKLRGCNRMLNDTLARKHTVRRSTGEDPNPEIVILGVTAVAARSGITRLAEKLGFSWEEARRYA
ncbi:MAG: hypothetical protein V4682_04175 [Patescibacteria group bacterium]